MLPVNSHKTWGFAMLINYPYLCNKKIPVILSDVSGYFLGARPAALAHKISY